MLNSKASNELTVVASQYVKEGEYWIEQLSGDLVKTGFPYDRLHTKGIGEGSLKSVKLSFTGELYSKLMWISNGFDHTLHMILVAGVVVLLNKYTGNRDIIVGAPIYKQDSDGDFINTVLALRNYIEDHVTFKELLLQVRQTIVEANENQNFPIETLLYRLDMPFSGDDFPLFDVVVLLENVHDKKYIEFTKPGVMFSFNRTDEAVEGLVEFNGLLYEPSSIEGIAAHFTALIREVLFNIDVKAADISILSREEKRRQLIEFNDTRVQYPADKTIHELIEEQVARTPNHTAAAESEVDGKRLTYKELDKEAEGVAGYLSAYTHPGDMVGIVMQGSIYLAVAVLGVLKSGAAYVPIDPGLPAERIERIIDDAGIGVVISLKKYIRGLNRLQWECPSFHRFLCVDSSDVYGEEEVEKSELMDETLWDYVAETAVDEVTGGGWNTSFTGEPFTKKEMEEYGDNVLKKVSPVLRKDTRVLEIGCASGISMYRIAPGVGFYHGTDLSGKIIEKNKHRVEKEGHKNIVLTHIPAHRIDEIKDRNFDLIILNSVIQSFHGHNYLRAVIRKTIDLLGEQGYLYLGDIMDQDLKDALIADLIEFKRTHRDTTFKTKTDFSTELFVARGFFEDLAVDMPEIKGMEFSGKIYTIENELTKYRYDALITVDKTGAGREGYGKKHKYQDDVRALENCGKKRATPGVAPNDPAYVIYTSGTTGAPRGVMIEHKSLVNYTWWARKTYIETGGNGGGTFPLYSSISFDLTVTSMYLPLLTGCAILIYDKGDDKYTFPIHRIVKEDRVDVIKATPSHLKLLQNEFTGNNRKLKKFIVGGEELERSLAQNIYLGFSRGVDIYNEYGPTEATVGCMIYKYDYGRDRRRSVSIGLPVDNVSIYILDGFFNPVPINGVGEIYIGGDALARGYVNHVELTADKFIMVGNDRLYKTGDLARRLGDGNIEFLGRIDEQVKIRGYRIELKEIENRLLAYGDIKEAVVITREADNALCAYIVRDMDRNVEISEIIDYLSLHLPDYMIPSYFVPIDQVPLTPNGKIDKRRLPEPEIEAAGGVYAAPTSVKQTKLVEIWSEVLGLEKSTVGIDANFFELGGHSLKATIVIAEIHKALNVKVPLAEIFKRPSIRELASYIEEIAEDKYALIEAAEEKDYYVLSSAQKRLYVLQQMDVRDTGYNEPVLMVLEGVLDKETFEETFRRLIRRHESLRTSFQMVDGEPVQRIHKAVDFEIEYHDITSRPLLTTAGISERFVRPFDLSRPLLRVGLVKEDREKHLLMVDMHHIVTDGTSMGIVAKDFMMLYKGEAFIPLRIQYKDFSEWQHRESVRESLKRQEAYWLGEFEGEIPVLTLPTDYARPVLKSFEGSQVGFDVAVERADALRELARQEEATLYMVLLAIFNILLSKLSDSEDIVVGTVTAGRRQAELQPMVGMFVNTLGMRNYPLGDRSFNEFLREVRERTLEAFENQDYPFEDLVERLAVPRDTGRNPLFEAMFALQNMEIPAIEIPQLSLLPYNRENNASKFDIVMHGFEAGRQLMFNLQYCTKLFKTGTIERIIGYFKKIVSAVTDMPGEKLSKINLISLDEKNRLLYEFNDTAVGYPGDKTIHQLFREQAKKTRHNIAVICEDKRLTYGELDERTDRIAEQLKIKGVKPGGIVGIVLGRSIEMAAGILGILKAGGAYLPIDINYPGQRIKYLLEDSNVKVLLTLPEFRSKVKPVVPVQVIDVGEIPSTSASTLSRVRSANPAYIIYTSGTTGIPKGVVVEHASAVNTLLCRKESYKINAGNVALQLFSYCFDGFVTSFFTPLLGGASVVFLSEEGIKDTNRIKEAVVKNRVTHFISVPAVYRLILESLTPEEAASLRLVTLAGDTLQPDLPEITLQKNNKLELAVEYGVTEASVMSTMGRHHEQERENIAKIGKPVWNTMIYIMDRYRELQAVGIPGELCISGVGVARGYLNLPELTAKKFKRMNMSSASHLSYIYRTGDRARWLPEGSLEFLGRIDSQVKIRGFRIEPGEIENHLLTHDEIKEAVVIAGEARERAGSDARFLSAYLVSVEGKTFAVSELREFLLRKLPEYMVPSYFIKIDFLPLTSNGKVDKKALKSMGTRLTGSEEFVPPKNELEKAIAEAWKKVLDVEKIGVNDNFFEVGGNSINILKLSTELGVLGRDIHVAALFQYSTIASFARHLESRGNIEEAVEDESESKVRLEAARNRLQKRRNRT